MSPLRVAVVARDPLTAAERHALASVLFRVGFSITVVPSQQAEVAIVYGEGESPDGLPAHRVCRVPEREWRARWKDGAMSLLTSAAQDGEVNWEKQDVPKIFHSILRGWEELDGREDEHGRFRHEESVAVRSEAIDVPALDVTAGKLGRRLHFLARPNRQLPPRPWFFCPTFDIDSAGMFYGRTAFRSLKAIAENCPGRLPMAAWHAVRTRLHMTRDPHLRVRELGEMLEGMDAPATFFVQTHRRHRLDNYDLAQRSELVDQLRAVLRNGVHEVGLHSSYATRDGGTPFFSAQWRCLRGLLGKRVERVHRAHYLRTPERGVYPGSGMVDSSLGYGGRDGFRRGTAYPFAVAKNVELPPAVMDTTLRYHLGLSAEEGYLRAEKLMGAVEATGGAFVPIFHPNNMDEYLWPGWRFMLVDLVTEAKRRGAVLQSLARTARLLYKDLTRLVKELEEHTP